MTAVDIATIAIFAGALISLASFGLVLNGAAARRRRQRIDDLRRRWRPSREDGEDAANLLNEGEESTLGASLLKFMPRSHMLRHRLMQAGMTMSPGRYATLNFLLGFAVGGFAWFLFGLPAPFAGALAVAAGFGLPHWFVGLRIRRRLKRFGQLFPEAIDLMIRGIKSGLPIGETIASIGQEMADPVGTEFRRVADAVKLGQSLDEGLWDVAKRLDTPEFKFFVISLSVQRETGGNLAETLENLADVLRKRLQMQLKIRAMSSEARASAYIIGSLPFIMFGILMLMNREYVMTLFTDPRGLIIVAIGLTTMLIGALVMAKMVRFDI